MASPAEIGQGLPETLPEDFSDWDNQSSSATVQAGSGDFEAPRGLEDFPTPPAPAPGPEGVAAPVTIPDKSSGLGAPRALGDSSRPLAPTPRPEVTPELVPYGLRPGAWPPPARVNQDDAALLRRSRSSSGLAAGVPISISRAEEVVHLPQEVSLSPQPRKVSVPDDLGNGTKTPAQGELSIEELRKSLRPRIAVMNAADKPIAKRKRVKVAAIGACSILMLSILAIWLFRPGTPSKMNASVEPGLTANQVTPADSNTHKPSPSTASIPDVSPTAVQTRQTPVSPSTEAENEETSPTVQPTRVQSKMMDDQLAAPIRISRDIHKPGVENEPPPSAGIGMTDTQALGGGSTIASVFTGSRTVVHGAPAATTVSAGVAVGLLIQRTPPVYPAIAKDARVSGTVELQATISKAGIVKDIRVVSGPPMLRRAAVDAVQTWRYKPYKLNNEPTEVQTTINVVFSLGP